LFAPLAFSQAALFEESPRGRIRKCAKCVLHFYDTSKSEHAVGAACGSVETASRSPLTPLAGGPVDGTGSPDIRGQWMHPPEANVRAIALVENLVQLAPQWRNNTRTLNLFPSFLDHSKTSSVVIAIAAFRLL
jgi:hypothetical protein